jgi:glc operon protein GlcG
MNVRNHLIVGTVIAGLSPSAFAQTAATPPPYGPPITLDMARKTVDAAEAEARRNNWNVVITIVDGGGHLVYMRRLDGTQTGSVKIAEGKAVTAAAYRRSTKVLEDSLQTTTRLLAVQGLMPLEGGLPIVVDGKIVGGIGVSGVLSSQDAQIATAGLAGLK